MRKDFPFLDLRFLPGSRFLQSEGTGSFPAEGQPAARELSGAAEFSPFDTELDFAGECRGPAGGGAGTAPRARPGHAPGDGHGQPQGRTSGLCIPARLPSEQERQRRGRPALRAPRPPRPAPPPLRPAGPSRSPAGGRQAVEEVRDGDGGEREHEHAGGRRSAHPRGRSPAQRRAEPQAPPAGPCPPPPRHAKVKSASETGAARRRSGRSGSASARPGLAPLPLAPARRAMPPSGQRVRVQPRSPVPRASGDSPAGGGGAG